MVQSELRHALLVPQPASVAMAFNYSNSCSAPFFFSLLLLPKTPIHSVLSSSLPDLLSPPLLPNPPLHRLISLSPSFNSYLSKSLIPPLSPQPVCALPCSANPLFPVPVIAALCEFAFKHCAYSLGYNNTAAPLI